MNNSFLEILKPALRKDIVLITYRQKENIFHHKFFLKAEHEKFYNDDTGCFQLVTHINNKLETIKACDIIKFQFSRESDSEDVKRNFVLLSENIKSDYEKLLPSAHMVNNFDDYFFNENVNLNNFKLASLLEVSSLKDFENNSQSVLLDIKKLWKRKIEEHKLEILKYLNNEIDLNNSVYDKETIEEIKDLISNFNADDDLKLLSSKEEFFQYWPTLLLPAPDFINEVLMLYKKIGQ